MDMEMDRKARIAALRAKAGRAKLPPPEDHSAAPVLQVVALVNQSMTTTTNAVSKPSNNKRQKGGIGTDKDKPKEESILVKALRQAQAEAQQPGAALAVESMPKKINADLKREIQPRLDKLERRTQKAIVALLRERLEREASAEIDD